MTTVSDSGPISMTDMESPNLDTSPPLDPHLNTDSDGDNKICKICGDRALGYNFNVISCESCKAFFRRNANKRKEFRCPSNGNCAITVTSRRFCQRCRLKKCFQEGMKKEWIMSDDALQERRQRNEGKKLESLQIPVNEEPMAKKLFYGSSTTPQSASIMFRNPNDYISHASPSTLDWSPSISNWSTPISNFVPSPMSDRGFYSPMSVSSKGSFGVSMPIASSPMQTYASSPYLPTLLCNQNYQQSANLNMQQQRHPLNPEPQNAQLQLPRKESNPDQNEYIYVPKSVLANLVNQCYSTLQNRSDLQPDPDRVRDRIPKSCPPVLTRLRELTDRVTDSEERRAPLKCICHCVCGAKSTGSTIGVDKTDKWVATDQKDSECQETQSQRVQCGKAGPKNSSVWLSLDSQDSCVWNESSMDPNQPSSSAPGMSLFKWLRMEELLAANQVMNEPTVIPALSQAIGGEGVDSKSVDVTMMTNICIRRIIRMCKKIGAFKTLCQEDQIALLKGSCTEILVLRGVMAYNAETDTFDVNWYPTAQPQVKLNVLKSVKGNCYDEHKKYLQSFEEIWRRDDRIMLILGALTLFNPRRRNVVHEDVISREHQFYMELLKNYLDVTYQQEAQRFYLALCDRLDKLQQCVHEYAATIFLDVNPRNLEPLLLEVFDLKDDYATDRAGE